MHSGTWNDNRSLLRGQGGNSYSTNGYFGERPLSQQDVSSAQSHLVLLKEKLRQRKTQRTPTGASRGEAFQRDYSPAPNTASGARNGRFESVASSEMAHPGSRASLGNRPDFSGYDNGPPMQGDPLGISGRGREVPSPRYGGMTWDAPSVPHEEKESPLSTASYKGGGRAPAVTARRLSGEMNEYSNPPQFSHPTTSAFGNGGGIGAQNFGGLGSSMRSMTGGHVKSSPSSVHPAAYAPSSASPAAFASSSAPPPAFAEAEADLIQCPDCGRKFNAESIDRHMKICKKVFQSKRKQFNSAENRLGELENAPQLIANAKRLERAKEGLTEKKDKPGKSAKDVKAWEKKSLEFRAAILAAKAQTGDDEARAKADEIQQKLQEVGGDGLDPGMIKCQYCGRTFNKEAGERHMKICVKTFGSKPGGGRLIKGGGSRMYKDSAASNGPPQAPVGRQPVSAQNASHGNSTASSEAPAHSPLGLGAPTRTGMGQGSSVVRISSGSSGQSGYPASVGGSYAQPTAQTRVSSANRNRGNGTRQATSGSSSRIAPGSMHR